MSNEYKFREVLTIDQAEKSGVNPGIFFGKIEGSIPIKLTWKNIILVSNSILVGPKHINRETPVPEAMEIFQKALSLLFLGKSSQKR
jgi:hypothetical protein